MGKLVVGGTRFLLLCAFLLLLPSLAASQLLPPPPPPPPPTSPPSSQPTSPPPPQPSSGASPLPTPTPTPPPAAAQPVPVPTPTSPPAASQLAAPSDLRIDTYGDDYGLWLSWRVNSQNESGFEISNGVETREVGARTNVYRWGHLNPGEYMCFAVRAYQDSPTPRGEKIRSYSAWEPNVSPSNRCGTTATNPSSFAVELHPGPIYAGYGLTGQQVDSNGNTTSLPAEFTLVSGTWFVPRVECPPLSLNEPASVRSRASPWIGLAGKDITSQNPTNNYYLIQVGTVSQCDSGNVSYNAVYDIVWVNGGAPPQTFEDFEVEPNDQISAQVRYEASTDKFYIEIRNVSKGKSAPPVEGAIKADPAHNIPADATVENSRSSALWVVEAEPAGCKKDAVFGLCHTPYPDTLAKFATPIEFLGVATAINPGPKWSPIIHHHQFDMIKKDAQGNSIKKTEVYPYDLSGAFTIKWLGW